MLTWTLCSLSLAVGPTLPVSGHLGDDLDGPRSIQVRLSEDEAGQVSPWTETLATLVERGAFSVQLGGTSPLAGVDFSGDLWVAVAVDGGAFSAAVPVGWAPRASYAADAGDAATLEGHPAGDFQASAWRPAWTDLQGLPSASSDLTARIEDVAYSTPSELTTALSGQYRAAGYVPSWSEITGDPASNAALTTRVTALAYDTPSELTGALDATYLRLSGGTIAGNLNATGTISSTGAMTAGGTLTASGAMNVTGALTTSNNVTVGGNLSVTGFELPYQRHIAGRDWLSTGAITISPQANATYDTLSGTMTWGANFNDTSGLPATFNVLPVGVVAANARLRVQWDMGRECVTTDCDGFWRMYDGAGGYVQVQSYDNDSGGLAIGNSATWLRTVTGQGGVANRLVVDISIIPGQNEAVFVEAFIGSTRRFLSVDLAQNLNPATGLWMEFVRGDAGESYRESYVRTQVSRAW
jgi:hypothetical protein